MFLIDCKDTKIYSISRKIVKDMCLCTKVQRKKQKYMQKIFEERFLYLRDEESRHALLFFYINISVKIIMIDPIKKYTLFFSLYVFECGIYSEMEILIIIPAVIARVIL